MSTIIVKIPRTKVDEMNEYAKMMLHYGGRMMSCIEEMQNSEDMNERTRMGMGMRGYDYRYPVLSAMPNDIGMRGYDDDDFNMVNERRMRNSRGRYI